MGTIDRITEAHDTFRTAALRRASRRSTSGGLARALDVGADPVDRRVLCGTAGLEARETLADSDASVVRLAREAAPWRAAADAGREPCAGERFRARPGETGG